MIFINEKIKSLYGGNIGSGIFKKELRTLNQQQKNDGTIEFNQNFLYKKIKDIFSDNVSGRYTNYPLDNNKRLIEKLLNEKDEFKKKFFTDLFDLTFLDCLKHYTGEKFINELRGFDNLEDEIGKIRKKYKEDGNDYVEALKYYLKNYESILNHKKPRKLKQEKE